LPRRGGEQILFLEVLLHNSHLPRRVLPSEGQCFGRCAAEPRIVILLAAGLSLLLVVQWWLKVPIAGSILLFLGGSAFYVFTVAALGILLGTVAATMGQFGLLAIPVLLVMMLLSGGTTPMESMPVWLQYLMNVISATPHFVIFAQDVLYRGADASIVWPEILAMTVIGSVYFGFALYRFRRVIFGG
jgi:ABC-2 type transport system permease protein